MNIVPISESAVVCSCHPQLPFNNNANYGRLLGQLQSEQDIVEVVLGMNNLTVLPIFFVDFKPACATFRTTLG